MLIDARELPNGHVIACDVCIVGAGAAGITLANALTGRALSVCVLESGDLTAHADTQALYRGEAAGLPYTPLDAARVRYFGGTTNHWSGMCRPLDPIDFEQRDWVPHSGWPFDRATLDPYYAAAQASFALAPVGFDVENWERPDAPRLEFAGDAVATTMFRLSGPARFGSLYQERLHAAANVAVYLNANALHVALGETGGAVDHVAAGCLTGSRFRVAAKQFVLAAGGIENPRLLLTSRDVQSRGIGNDNDLVGRYFMDHPGLESGAILLADPRQSLALYEGASRHVNIASKIDGGSMEPFVTPAEKAAILEWAAGDRDRAAFEALVAPIVQRTCVTCHNPGGIAFFRPLRTYEEVLAVTGEAELQTSGAPRDALAGLTLSATTQRAERINNFVALLEGGRGWSEILFEDSFWASVGNVASNFLDVAASAYRSQFDRDNKRQLVRLVNIFEPSPNPDSRVTLLDERDALGINLVRLDWRLNESDKRTIVRAQEVIAQEAGRAELGRVLQPLDPEESGWPADLTHGWHHMGTTRMHRDPKRGVVDADCRVHGVANLYVAGSSVFPTYGFSQPTFTIVALALRLAERLQVTP